ncbi:MAG: glycosyltransferase family 39 protein [Elusimicrobia bacterium]|nr:glycosyltransferase family 39 protein [Elusimicrobiota bacterium]
MGPTPTAPSANRRALLALAALALATGAALWRGAPRPFGYVWDLHHEGVVWTWAHRALPRAADCGECYHPPLFFLCGAPLYGAGAAAGGGAAAGLRALCLLSLASAGVVIWFCRRTLLLIGRDDRSALLGTALAVAFPCLAISAYGAENDVLLAAVMSAFFYALCRRHLRPARAGAGQALLVGALAGLAALTKYSGLLTLPTAFVVLAPGLLRARRRGRTARDLALILAAAAAVCGWHYAGNLAREKRLLLGPPWDKEVFTVGSAKVARFAGRYDLRPFRVAELVDLYRPERAGTLDSFPASRGVLAALHAQAWTDMSFFSVSGRHGWVLPVGYATGGADMPMIAATPGKTPREPVYPDKKVPLPLVALLLRAGLIPTALAAWGFAATLRRRALRPFAAFAGISAAVYAWWFLGQPAWGLKTKYLLFLLPAYAAYATLGLRAAYRRDPRLGAAAAAAFLAALAVSEAYLWTFALG